MADEHICTTQKRLLYAAVAPPTLLLSLAKLPHGSVSTWDGTMRIWKKLVLADELCSFLVGFPKQ